VVVEPENEDAAMPSDSSTDAAGDSPEG